MAYGEYPIIFTKPPGTGILIESKGERAGISRWTDALAGPYEDIPINPICLNMDYEVREALYCATYQIKAMRANSQSRQSSASSLVKTARASPHPTTSPT